MSENNNSIKLEFSSIFNELNKQQKVNSKGSYHCSYCIKVFRRKDRFDRHLFTHTGIKLFKCTRENCNKEYTNEVHLRRHIRTFHDEPPIVGSYVCNDCGQEFTNSDNRRRHYRNKHMAPHKYPCTECNQAFHVKNLLHKHLKNIHNIGDFKYFCDVCQKGFFNKRTHEKHLKTHVKKETERPCANCELTFKKWSDLVRHRREAHRQIHQGTLICDLCSKVFNWKKSLRYHMKVHQNEITVFQCTYKNCSKFYTTKSNLKCHIRSKHEGCHYYCTLCPSKFTTNQRLQEHVLRHTNMEFVGTKATPLSLLVGLKVEEIINNCYEIPKIDVPTESEISE